MRSMAVNATSSNTNNTLFFINNKTAGLGHDHFSWSNFFNTCTCTDPLIFNPKYPEWYGLSLNLEHTIQVCRGEKVKFKADQGQLCLSSMPDWELHVL